MIILKSEAEIEKMRRASRIVAQVLREIESVAVAGATTKDLDRFAEGRIVALGGLPAFKGYRGYQATLCTSVNETVVHGIPSARRLEEGDIIGIDCGVMSDGYYGDAAVTLGIGPVDPDSARLMAVTRRALECGIEEVRVGHRLGDISWAVESQAKSNGYGVVRDFVGHGIGQQLHEDPQLPNFGQPNTGIRLTEGMVLAIEPMFNLGTHEVKILEDGWTAVTVDGKRSAHFEHTVALTGKGPEILTVA